LTWKKYSNYGKTYLFVPGQYVIREKENRSPRERFSGQSVAASKDVTGVEEKDFFLLDGNDVRGGKLYRNFMHGQKARSPAKGILGAQIAQIPY